MAVLVCIKMSPHQILPLPVPLRDEVRAGQVEAEAEAYKAADTFWR